jgi:hypothetical protein
MYKFLKPGGELIVFEHVVSNHWFTRIAQRIYTNIGWRFLTEGCEMDRDTVTWLLEAPIRNGEAGWKTVELKRLEKTEGWWSVFPKVCGRLVK